MRETFVIDAQPRTEQGKGASRRLRRSGHVPAIVYGGEQPPQMLALDHNELWKHLKHESFYSHVLTLKVGDRTEQVVLKDLHRHPVKEQVLHADLLRVQAGHTIRMRVPLHFLNEATCVGVKTGGGMLDRMVTEVEVECLPNDLPEYIELDVGSMNVGDALHLSDLKLPAGVAAVELKHGNDAAVVAVHQPRVSAADAGEETPQAEG